MTVDRLVRWGGVVVIIVIAVLAMVAGGTVPPFKHSPVLVGARLGIRCMDNNSPRYCHRSIQKMWRVAVVRARIQGGHSVNCGKSILGHPDDVFCVCGHDALAARFGTPGAGEKA